MSNHIDEIEVISKKNKVVIALEQHTSIKALIALYVDYVLAKAGGNKVHASRTLGIDRRTIQRWSKRTSIPAPAPTNPYGVSTDESNLDNAGNL